MSGKRSRNKGAQYERDLYNFFLDQGFEPIKRNRGGYDGDDLRLAKPNLFSIEAKNHKTLKLASWIDQAKEQADDLHPVVIHKRNGSGDINKHYVTMEADTFRAVVDAINESSLTITQYSDERLRGVEFAGVLDSHGIETDAIPIIYHPRTKPDDYYVTTNVYWFTQLLRKIDAVQ